MLKSKKSKTIEWLQNKLGSSQDIVFREFQSGMRQAQILFIKTLCDEKKLQETFYKPFYETNEKEFDKYLNSLPNISEHKKNEETLTKMLLGSAVILLGSKVLILDVEKVENNSITEATVEKVIQGPLNALTEDVSTNIHLIRNRYPQATLRIEEAKLGKLTETKIAIVYDKNKAQSNIVQAVKDNLDRIETDVIMAAGQLHNKMTKQKRTLFPTMMITERPDRITYNLAEGKVVLLIDGTLFALIAPSVFYDFMSSMEDVYQSHWIGRFILSLRYIGLFISLLAPSLYVGITAYSTDLFRVQLALTIAGSRSTVPYPAFIEVLFMLLMMELLTEASVRLPQSIGSTATTVGGLILGTAAVEAGLVSNVMIIIVASVAIANFVIPINAMSFAMRVTKYILLALTIFFGLVGLMIGIIALVGYLAKLESYGQPYLKLFIDPSKRKGQ
ncbi:spore germination protein [Salirhabdus euzebyi]|uniref:Spore germination protein n=1 Tax=Salirhabdus euzebyi TaxID=394506 RepID=A0A841PZ71_9BACI|nr:spore germination protein [Salirhabdus euzebyi]MBB6452581.1 spore germination protein [Salirhabdus euzebyi]